MASPPSKLISVMIGTALVFAVGACSSNIDGAPSTETAVTTGADDQGPDTGDGAGGGDAESGDTADTAPQAQSRATIEEYYRKLGVEDAVIECYLTALGQLGVTNLDQLETDQAKGIEAADRFDQCVTEHGSPAPTGN